MQRVERHIIVNNKRINDLCFKSKNLYNYTNFLIRDHFFKTRKMLREYDVSTKLAEENQTDYRALPAQTSQQIIKSLFRNWRYFFKALKEFKKNSKCDFLASEKIKKHESYLGRRIKRGLFKSSVGVITVSLNLWKLSKNK